MTSVHYEDGISRNTIGTAFYPLNNTDISELWSLFSFTLKSFQPNIIILYVINLNSLWTAIRKRGQCFRRYLLFKLSRLYCCYSIISASLLRPWSHGISNELRIVACVNINMTDSLSNVVKTYLELGEKPKTKTDEPQCNRRMVIFRHF